MNTTVDSAGAALASAQKAAAEAVQRLLDRREELMLEIAAIDKVLRSNVAREGRGSLRERALTFVRSQGAPVSGKSLALACGKNNLSDMAGTLTSMLRKRLIVRVGRGMYALPKKGR